MFADITSRYLDVPKNFPRQEAQDLWNKLDPGAQQSLIPQRLCLGIYLSPSSPDIEEDTDDFSRRAGNLLHRYDDARKPLDVLIKDGMLKSYGVCDGVVDILNHPQYSEVLSDRNRVFTIFLNEIRREHEGPGGWRWEKNGDYIGTRTPQRDYLYDEPDIESVYVFHIIEHILAEEQDMARHLDKALGI